MECHGESRFAERLHRAGFAEDARARGNQHVQAAVRVNRVRDEAVDRRRRASVESIGQGGIDHGAFEDAVQLARRG